MLNCTFNYSEWSYQNFEGRQKKILPDTKNYEEKNIYWHTQRCVHISKYVSSVWPYMQLVFTKAA